MKQIIGIAALTVSIAVGVIHFTYLDGFGGLLFALALGQDTEYAPKYSEAKFKRIIPGMTKAEVLELVGEPLSTRADAGPSSSHRSEYWWYSRSPSNTHFHHRYLVFAGDRVTEVGHEFYVD